MELTWRPHPKQVPILESDKQFNFVAAGRRFGKNEVAWMKLLLEGLKHPSKSPGLYWWVAPINRELVPASQTIRRATPPEFFKRFYSRQNVYTYIELQNGTEIYFHSANTEDSLRGSGLNGMVIDEAGSFPEARYNEELLPSLMDYGGWVLAIGTPKGRNWFYEGWLKGQDQETYPNYASWKFSSYENTFERGGYIKKDSIDEIAGNLPEIIRRQEIMAEFLTDEGAVFRPYYGGDYINSGLHERRYTKGLDIARTEDFTVATALDNLTGNLVAMDRWRELEWSTQHAKIKSFDKRFPGTWWLDATSIGGDQFYERLRKDGILVRPFKYTAQSKKELIENLMLCFDEQKVMVPKTHPIYGDIMRNELEAFTYEVTRTGNVRYNAPEGLHDDCVNSLALAAWGLHSRPQGYFR